MNIVSESNLGKIKSVFNDNSSNAHYYKIIDKTFKGFIKNLEFAKPIIQVNSGHVIWQSIAKGPYLKYESLDKEKKRDIDRLIQNRLYEMSQILGDDNDQNFLESIIEIPSEASIFYTADADHNINVILTEWGYVKDDHIKTEGVLKKIFSTSMKSFIVKFKSVKSESLEGVNAIISSEDLNLRTSSNKEGLIKLNNLKKGNTLQISSTNDSFDDVRLKIEILEEYTIIVKREYELSFNFIDSNSNPVSNHNFLFKSDVFVNKNIQTDFNGNYNFKHPESEGDFYIFSPENEELLLEVIPSENHQYTIVYNPPLKEDPVEDIIEEHKLEKSIELEFLNWRKKPITNKEIDLYGKNGKTTYTTNDNGLVYLNSLNRDIDYAIFMDFKNTSWKKEFKHSNKSRYTFIVKKKRFLWMWLPFLLFFLCLLMIPTQVDHHYTILDKKSKQPIELANVTSSEISKYQIQSLENKTDSLGNLSLEYGKYPLYKQIFSKLSTDVFVSKSGYESLDAKIPLSYFKTTESKIYLNKLAVRLDPIGDCNSGGDANNAGGNSIKEFNLIKNKGAFVFTYNTGDTHADIIKIYDCSKLNMYNEQPIWSINEASGGDKNLTLNFTNQIITVEVIGGGNIQSIWRYHVECPM